MGAALVLLVGFYFWLFKISNFDVSIGPFLILNTLIYLDYGYIVYLICRSTKIHFIWIVSSAFLIGIFFLLTPPSFSTDIYRYFWDGWLTKSGINAYSMVPQDARLASFHTSHLYELLDWKDAITPYPPFAQLLFVPGYTLYNAWGVIGGKLIFVLPLVLSSFFIYKFLDKKLCAIFILNPLLALEIMQSGHLDGWVILFLFLSVYFYFRNRYELSALFISFSFLTKIYPLIFVPFFLIDLLRKKHYQAVFRFVSIFMGLTFIFYIPFAKHSLFQISTYITIFKEQEFNASVYRYLREVISVIKPLAPHTQGLVVLLCAILFVTSILYLLSKKLSIRILLTVGIAYIMFSSTIFPWHTLFLVPLVILETYRLKRYSLVPPLLIMQFLLTFTYFSPHSQSVEEAMLNFEYATLFLLIFIYTVPKRISVSAICSRKD